MVNSLTREELEFLKEEEERNRLLNLGIDPGEDPYGLDVLDAGIVGEVEPEPTKEIPQPLDLDDPTEEIPKPLEVVESPAVDTQYEDDTRRRLDLPDGSYVTVSPRYTDEEALVMARRDFPESFEPQGDVSVSYGGYGGSGDSGPLDALASNFYRAAWGIFDPGAQAAFQVATGDEGGYDEAQRRLIEISREANRIAPNLVALEDISEAYDKDGVFAASAKAMEFGAEAIFGSLGYLGPSAIVGGVVGGIAGSLLGPGGTIAGSKIGAATLGTLAFTGTQFANYMSSNMERAYQEGQVDIGDVNMAKQIAAAGGQAALEAVTARLAGGFKLINRGEKNAALSTVGRWLDDLDNTSGVKKVLAVMMEEEVAEVGQQALERYAAGLPVSPADDDAAREYAHIALASLAPSAGFGLVGAGTGKWNQVKAEKAKAGRAEIAGEIVRVQEEVHKSDKETAGQKIENLARAKEAELQEIRNRRAKLEVELHKQRAADESGRQLGESQQKFRDAINELDERESALIDRSRLEQELIDGGAVSPKDIHKLLDDRKIKWDDDPALMAFTLRVTGKPKIDMLDAKERLKLYKRISHMPRQEVQTSLAITSDDLAIELAKRIRGQADPTLKDLKDLKEVLGVRGNSLTAEELGPIADAYRLRMHKLGLTRYQEGKPSEKLFDGKLPVNKDTYKQIIADAETAGQFPLLGDLEKYGIKTKKAYEKLRAYAVVNRDIALENDIFVPALDVGVKPRFRLEVDGQRTDQVFTSQDAADAAAQNIYDEDTARRDAARERENIPSVRGMVPEAVREPDRQSTVAVIREEAIEPTEVVSQYKYDVAKKEGRHWVIRRDDEIVKIESSEAKANNWIKGQKAGTARFDFTVNGELVSSHKKWSDGQTAKKNWLESITTSAYDTARAQFIADNESGWVLGEKALEKEANKAGKDAAKAAEMDARDHNRLSVKRKPIPAASYSAGLEPGYLLKESRVRESGRQGSFRPIGVFKSESEAKNEAAKLLRKREGAEVWAGRKTRGRKQALESKMKRRGERAYVESQIPMPAAPAVETGPVQELESVQSVVDKRIPIPERAAEGAKYRTMDDVPVAERKALLNEGIEAQGRGAESFEKFLLDTFGTTEGHGGWTNQLAALKAREVRDFPDVEQITNPDGSIVYRGYHGTFEQGLSAREAEKQLGFGGLHTGTETAARARIEDTRPVAHRGRDFNVIPTETRLSNPYGSFDKPISEHDLFLIVNDAKAVKALKDKGHDGIIYENSVEDRGKISVLSFEGKNVTPRAAEGAEAGQVQEKIDRERGVPVPERDFPTEEELLKMTKEELQAELGTLEGERKVAEDNLRILKLDPDERAKAIELEAEKTFEEIIAPEVEADVRAIDAESKAEEELSGRTPNVEPEDGPSPEAETTPIAKEETVLQRVARKYGFANPVPREATNLLDRHERRGSRRVASFWGQIPYNADGNAGTKSRVVVPVGHTEGGLRGYGEAALNEGNPAIAKETPFNDWKELLSGFFRELKNKDASRPETIYSTNEDPGRISYIWNDPGFENPVTIVFDLDPETRSYNVVAARPSVDFVQPYGSLNGDRGVRVHGTDTSAQAMIAYLGEKKDHKWTPAERKANSLNRSSAAQTPESVRATSNLIPKDPNNGKSAWQRFSNWDWSPSGDATRRDRVDKYRAAFLDKYHRILSNERRLSKQEKREFSEQMSWSSAHAAALNRDRAGGYWQESRRIGHPIYEAGVSIVGGYKRDLDPESNGWVGEPGTDREGQESKGYGTVIINTNTGRPVITDGMELSNKIRVPEGTAPFEYEGVTYTPGMTLEIDLYDLSKPGGIETIVNPVAVDDSNNLIAEVFKYVSALRAGRLDAEGKRVSFDPEEIAAGKKLAEDNPAILVVVENYQRWNDGLVDFGVATGYISPEQGAIYKKHHDYVPFFPGIDGMTTPSAESAGIELTDLMVLGVKPGIGSIKPIKKYKGHEKELMEPLEAITKNSFAIIEASLTTVAQNRALKDAAKLIGDDGLTVASRIGKIKPKDDSLSLVQTYEAGEKVWYSVADPLLHEAITGSLEGQHPYTGKLAWAANWTRELVTRGPEFMIANMIRDSLSVWITNRGDFRPVIDPLKKLLTNLRGMRKGPDPATNSLKDMKRVGIGATYDKGLTGKGSSMGEVLTSSGSNLNKDSFLTPSSDPVPYARTMRKLWKKIGEASYYSEMATREVVYESVFSKVLKKLEKDGVDQQTAKLRAMSEAGHQASEILNFSRHGNNPWLRLLTSVVPFMNARLQGIDQISRNLVGYTALREEQSDVRGAMLRRGSLIAGATTALAILNMGDDDYDKMRPETKDDYWLIPLPNGNFGGVPIPFEAGVIFKLFPELIVKGVLGENDGRQTLDSARRAILTTLNFNPMPTFAKPFIEQAANHNFFTGRPLVPFYMEGLGGQATRNTTSGLAQLIGKTFDGSPLVLENWERTLLPGIGQIPLAFADPMFRAVGRAMGHDTPALPTPRLTDLPIAKRFIQDEFSGGLQAEFYEMLSLGKEVNSRINRIQDRDPMEAARIQFDNRGIMSVYPVLKDIDKSMKMVRNERNNILNSNMSSSRKRVLIDSNRRYENMLLRNLDSIRKMADLPIDWKPW